MIIYATVRTYIFLLYNKNFKNAHKWMVYIFWWMHRLSSCSVSWFMFLEVTRVLASRPRDYNSYSLNIFKKWTQWNSDRNWRIFANLEKIKRQLFFSTTTHQRTPQQKYPLYQDQAYWIVKSYTPSIQSSITCIMVDIPLKVGSTGRLSRYQNRTVILQTLSYHQFNEVISGVSQFVFKNGFGTRVAHIQALDIQNFQNQWKDVFMYFIAYILHNDSNVAPTIRSTSGTVLGPSQRHSDEFPWGVTLLGEIRKSRREQSSSRSRQFDERWLFNSSKIYINFAFNQRSSCSLWLTRYSYSNRVNLLMYVIFNYFDMSSSIKTYSSRNIRIF